MLPHKNGPLIRFIYIGDTFLTVKCDKTLYICQQKKQCKRLKSCFATKRLVYVNGSSSYCCRFPHALQADGSLIRFKHSPLPRYNLKENIHH